MEKHTPGPWRRVDDYIYANPDNYIVAKAMGYPKYSKGNANLIAAAPELLEVLQELQECSEYWSEYFVPLGIHDRIKNAINKAKGIE